MTRKSLSKPKLADAERHNRFVAMAASDDVKDFEKAFQKAFKNAFDKIACQKDAARRRPSWTSYFERPDQRAHRLGAAKPARRWLALARPSSARTFTFDKARLEIRRRG
jgi:hypothetical protein